MDSDLLDFMLALLFTAIAFWLGFEAFGSAWHGSLSGFVVFIVSMFSCVIMQNIRYIKYRLELAKSERVILMEKLENLQKNISRHNR